MPELGSEQSLTTHLFTRNSSTPCADVRAVQEVRTAGYCVLSLGLRIPRRAALPSLVTWALGLPGPTPILGLPTVLSLECIPSLGQRGLSNPWGQVEEPSVSLVHVV